MILLFIECKTFRYVVRKQEYVLLLSYKLRRAFNHGYNPTSESQSNTQGRLNCDTQSQLVAMVAKGCHWLRRR